jgi:hypothetical protein
LQAENLLLKEGKLKAIENLFPEKSMTVNKVRNKTTSSRERADS